MPRFPCPEGEDETSWFIKEVETGLHAPLPGRRPRLRPQAGGLRERGHRLQGLPRLLPRRRRLHQLGQAQRHPRRPRPWLGRRLDVRLRHGHHRPRPAAARPDLRAVPQPRAHVDARLRRRLRRAPARRGDPLRHREVRRGARRPDRHLRHDQGQAGGQGRRAACWATRSRWARSSPRRCRRRSWARTSRSAGIFDPSHKRYNEAAEFRQRPRRGPRRRQEVVETALRPRGPEAPVGRARRRRHHVQRAADRPHPDHAPRAGRRRSSRSSTTRAASRSAWSRWTSSGCATSRSSTTPSRTSSPTAAIDIDLDALSKDPTDPATYELLGRGDTLGRVPARRRRHARPAAAHAARQLRGHLGRRSPSTDPARWASTRTPTTRCARTASRRSSYRSTPSSPRRSSRHPRHDLRPDRLPGAGHGDRPEARRATRSARPTCCAGRWARRSGGARRRVRRRSRRAWRPAASADASIKALWDVLRAVLRLRLQQGAHGRLRPGLLLDRLPQGQLPGRVHGRAAHQRARRQGQVGAVPQRVPADGHQGAAARRQRVLGQLHRRRHRHPLRPRRDPQRRRATSSTAIVAAREERAASPPSRTSSARSPAVVCNKRTIESLIKAGAFDSLGQTRRGPGRGARGARRRRSSRSSAGGHRPGLASSAASATTPTAATGRLRRAAAGPARSSGTSRRCCPSSARCSASTSPTTRCSASSTSSPARPTPRSRSLTGRRRPARRHHRHGRRADHRPAAQDDQEGRPLGDRDRRGPRRRHRGACSSRRPTRPSRTMLAEDAGRRRARPGQPARRRPRRSSPRSSRSPTSTEGAARPGRGVACRVTRCTPPVAERLKDVLGDAPRRHRGAPAAHPAGGARR